MISTKKLVQMARKWQRAAAMGRKKILFTRSSAKSNSANYVTSSTAQKGHFVVYSMDDKRFVVPLSYLNNSVLRMLFKKSEEEFGLSMDAPIILPLDSFILEYIISSITRGLSKDHEKALLVSVARSSCSSTLTLNSRLDEFTCQPIYVCS